MVNNPYPLYLLQLTFVCYFTTETILGFNLECLKNEKVDDQKIEAGNTQIVLLAMALVQVPVAS